MDNVARLQALPGSFRSYGLISITCRLIRQLNATLVTSMPADCNRTQSVGIIPRPLFLPKEFLRFCPQVKIYDKKGTRSCHEPMLGFHGYAKGYSILYMYYIINITTGGSAPPAHFSIVK